MKSSISKVGTTTQIVHEGQTHYHPLNTIRFSALEGNIYVYAAQGNRLLHLIPFSGIEEKFGKATVEELMWYYAEKNFFSSAETANSATTQSVQATAATEKTLAKVVTAVDQAKAVIEQVKAVNEQLQSILGDSKTVQQDSRQLISVLGEQQTGKATENTLAALLNRSEAIINQIQSLAVIMDQTRSIGEQSRVIAQQNYAELQNKPTIDQLRQDANPIKIQAQNKGSYAVETSLALSANAIYTSTARDGGASGMFNKIRYGVYCLENGTAQPEMSVDGTTNWRAYGSSVSCAAGRLTLIEVPYLYRYVRLRYQNSNKASTTFEIVSVQVAV